MPDGSNTVFGNFGTGLSYHEVSADFQSLTTSFRLGQPGGNWEMGDDAMYFSASQINFQTDEYAAYFGKVDFSGNLLWAREYYLDEFQLSMA